MEDIIKIIGIISLCILIIIFYPFISFWFAYLGGWLAKLVIGEKLALALNILFNTTHFTAEALPMIAGALGWIGGFFKSVQRIKN